jgi:hypothetical protein
MKDLCIQICAGLLLAAANNAALAQTQPTTQAPAGDAVRVTIDNFNRAETDRNFAGGGAAGQVGRFLHHREPMAIDFPIVRPNRDTLYSLSVFDLDAGPVTIALPNAGQRFMSMQVIDEDHYTPEVLYGAGTYTFTREKIGTRYVSLGVRILVDPADPVRHLIGKTPSILTSPRARTTARRSTGSSSRRCRWTPSGRSASITQRGTSRRTRSTLTRSTTPPRSEIRTVRSLSCSAAAMAKIRTACRP